MLLSQFKNVGRDLFTGGIISSHTGNLSIRLRNRLIITRRGCMLGALEEHDLIETGINKNDRFTPLASTDLAIHRAIYQTTPTGAVIHAHPPYAIALSLTETEIVPNCSEGLDTVGRVPILSCGMEVKSGGMAEVIAEALLEHRVVMVRGHGSFAIGPLIEDAFECTTALEENSQVICILKTLKVSTGGE